METNAVNVEKLKKIVWVYGLIVICANICGVLLPNVFQTFDFFEKQLADWNAYKEMHQKVDVALSFLTFVIPTVLCMTYIRGKKLEKHFINIPLMYSTFGTTGWIFYLLMEIVNILVAKYRGYDFSAGLVILPVLLNVIFKSLTTFTFAFFASETLHRKYSLPKYFPEGHLGRIEGIKQPSIKFLFFVKYISVTLFPIGVLIVSYFATIVKSKASIDVVSLIALLAIMLMGLIISIAFTSYFEKPIKSLKAHAEKIKEGDYSSHVNIISNDSFGDLADTMNDMVDSIQQQNQKIQENLNLTITRMAIMVESRDNSTGGHIKRTSDCVRVFVDGLKKNPAYSGISENYFNAVIKAAPMHDLGKIAVKDSILTKNGRFTDEEYEQMKKHSAEGARIVAAILEGENDTLFREIAVNVARYHHEKWNGCGYPEKISGEQIPFEARIMALADVFDALVSKRCYKESMSYDESFKIIEESLGSHFDPALGKEFLKCRPELEALYNSY